MGQASRKQKNSNTISDHVFNNIREVLIFALSIIAIYLFIAVFSYHPDDPGWSHSVTTTTIHNSAGTIGAWIADFLLYIFGYFGYLIPVLFLVSGWRLFEMRRNKLVFNQILFSIHGIGIILGLLGGCGIAWMHFQAGAALPHETQTNIGAGGILGDAVGTVLLETTGDTGSTLLMLAMFLMGLTLYTGLSWLWLTDKTGEITLKSIVYIRNLSDNLKDEIQGRRARKDREILLKQEKEIEELRMPPSIQEVKPEVKPSVRAFKEKQENLFEPAAETALPPLNLLDEPPPAKGQYSKEALEAMSRQVELKLKDFGVTVEVVAVHPGPVITPF